MSIEDMRDYDDDYGVNKSLNGLPQFVINPRWRSSEVIDICRLYRKDRDITLLPKLADALMEAWCDDNFLIQACHVISKEKDVSAYALRLVAIIESDELAGKVEKLKEIGREYRFTWQAMIEEPQEKDGVLTSWGSDLYSGSELGGDLDLFWDAVEAITGKTFDESHREEFGWSCSC